VLICQLSVAGTTGSKETDMADATTRSRAALWVGVAAVVVALMVAWLSLPAKEWAEAFHRWVQGLGIWGPIFFGLAYVVAVVALAPASALTIAGGLAFGFWAFPLVLVAATVGASLAFLVSRLFLRDRVRSFVEPRAKLRAIDSAVSDDGWKIVGLLRLSPLFPFNLQNYFFGATQIDFLPYLAATAVGIAPGTLVYVYLGTLGKVAGDAEDGGTLKWMFFGIGLVATIAVAVFVTRKAREKLKEAGVGEESR
jgi:uncharacterized membrane protein YdjX (TVP38/TMEM64 family)